MSQLNPLNDLSRVYLDHVAQVNQQNESDDVKRWQEGENELQKQIRISSGIIASGGAPTATMEEEKKAAKDYDGDGKVESGKDEYFGSKDKAIKKAMGKKVKEEVEEVDEAMSSYDRARKAAARRAADRNAARRRGEMGGRMERETYTSEGGTEMHHKGYRATPMKEAIGEGDPQDDAVKQYVKYSSKTKKKVKKESFSDWRNDLSNLIEVAPMTDVEAKRS